MKTKEQLAEHYAHYAAEFISLNSNRTSLITVTRAEITEKLTVVNILVSVFPEANEQHAIIFLKRLAGDFRHYLREKARMQRIPHMNFEIDYGEKNRVRINDISKDIPAEGAAVVIPEIEIPIKKVPRRTKSLEVVRKPVITRAAQGKTRMVPAKKLRKLK
jgi:ribosome-binding factor A